MTRHVAAVSKTGSAHKVQPSVHTEAGITDYSNKTVTLVFIQRTVVQITAT